MPGPEAENGNVGLDEATVDADPIRQFTRWFEEADRAELKEPAAMTLATVGRDGKPSARIVLLRQFDDRGFFFFTNFESHKGKEMAENPNVALTFYWDPLGRQVRIEGTAARTTSEESAEYFTKRPRGSKLSAWASPQSDVIESREALEKRFEEAAARYPTDDVPLPSFWGGFRVCPTTIEFFLSRPHRLHDRLRYTRQEDGAWRLDRLAP